MKLSSHSYSNDVFNSLLEGICKDVEIKRPTTKTAAAPIQPGQLFTSVTAETLDGIRDEEIQTIAGELEFAASRAHVAVTQDDLVRFASQVRREKLRGKPLERAAQKFCNELCRGVAPPQGAVHLGDEQASSHQVMSATYDPEKMSDGKTGGFMGMSKNPNSIWDTNAMEELAQKKFGDEQIKDSKKSQQDFQNKMKYEQWHSLQEQHSHPNQVQSRITNAGTGPEQKVADQKLPANSMSIFSQDRDFNRVPEITEGEKIAKLAEKRAEKAENAKSEWNKIEPSKKMENSNLTDKLFDSEDK